MMVSRIRHYALLLTAMFFWGGSWISADILVEIAPPMTIGFFRFLIASLLFLGLITLAGTRYNVRLSREKLKWYLGLGLTGIFGYGVFFLIGMGFTTSAQGSIIAGMNPITVSLIAHVVHNERLDKRWQYVGYLSGLFGVVVVVGIQAILDFNLQYLIGNLIILCAMIMWGIYSSVGKAAMKTLSSIEATGGGVLVGCLLFAVSAIPENPLGGVWISDPLFWFNVVFLGGAVTFLGFLFYFEGIKNIGASNSAAFINFVPVFGVLLSVLILGEPIYPTFIVGLALVIIGVIIINFPREWTKNHREVSSDDALPRSQEY